jgi:hypothetical protein
MGPINGGPINLSSARLRHASLRFATLTGADLSTADLWDGVCLKFEVCSPFGSLDIGPAGMSALLSKEDNLQGCFR